MKNKYSENSFYGTKKLGLLGERVVIQYLKSRGYIVVDQNVYARCGEIDIVAIDIAKEEHVFIEVKLRRSDRFGDVEYSINKEKMKKLYKMVDFYILAHPWVKKIRIDGIFLEKKPKKQWKIVHLKGIYL